MPFESILLEQQTIVSLKNVCKKYILEHGTVDALKNINLKIYCGQSIAIMGPSGSGKSTLLNLLGCLDQPTEGSYFLNQQDMSCLTDDQLSLIRSSNIGFVFQNFNLIPQLNVFDNIAIPFLYQSPLLSEFEMRERILFSIQQVNLQHRLYHFPSQLSGGETQRVAIARALAIRPLLILADEPTGNLDTETSQTILKLFQELHQNGSTLVIVTHDAQVGSHCQRIISMRDGFIVDEQINQV